MQQIITVTKSNAVAIKKAFQCVGIQIDDRQLKRLFKIQEKICDDLNWIECDGTRIQQLITPFLQTNDLSQENFMYVLENIIIMYYRIRQKYDLHTSDKRIGELLYEKFEEKVNSYKFIYVQPGIVSMDLAQYYCYDLKPKSKLYAIQSLSEKQIIKEGGQLRDEQTIYTY